jgi:hypothetical protein
MQNYSLTQAGNYSTLISLIVLFAPKFGVNISESDVTVLVTSVIALVGVLTSIYGRYRQGDVTILGVKDTSNY